MVGKWMRAIMLFRKDPSTLMYCHDFSSDNLNWFGVNFCVSWTHKNAPYKIIFYADYDIIKTHVMCCLARCWEWGPLGVVRALANVSCNNHFFHLVKKRLNKRYPFFLTSQKSSNKEYHDVKNLPNKKNFTPAHTSRLFTSYIEPRVLVQCTCLTSVDSSSVRASSSFFQGNIYFIYDI